jgi:hypothetical protein
MVSQHSQKMMTVTSCAFPLPGPGQATASPCDEIESVPLEKGLEACCGCSDVADTESTVESEGTPAEAQATYEEDSDGVSETLEGTTAWAKSCKRWCDFSDDEAEEDFSSEAPRAHALDLPQWSSGAQYDFNIVEKRTTITRADEVEKRPAPDGNHYTRHEFMEYYGKKKGQCQWNAAVTLKLKDHDAKENCHSQCRYAGRNKFVDYDDAKKSQSRCSDGDKSMENVSKKVNSRNADSRGKFQCQFIIQIEEDTKFRVVRNLIGVAGANMKAINQETNAKLRLRGRGSGFKEGPENKESTDDLMLCISCDDPERFAVAKQRVTEILEDVYAKYKVFCEKTGKPSPALKIKAHEGYRRGSR